MSLLACATLLLILDALDQAILVLFELALAVWARVLMIKHVALEYYGVFAVSVPGTTVCAAHPAAGAAAHPVALLPGLEQVKEVSDLMCHVLAPLEVVDVLEQEINSVVPVEYHEAYDEGEPEEVELEGAAEVGRLQELRQEEHQVAPEEEPGERTEEDVQLVVEVGPVRAVVVVGDRREDDEKRDDEPVVGARGQEGENVEQDGFHNDYEDVCTAGDLGC